MYHSSEFKYRGRAKQLIAFSGLAYGNRQPMDIDGCYEWRDKAVIFMEFKYKDTKAPDGQRLAYEHLTDDIRKAGKLAVTLICEHTVYDAEDDVKAEDAIVREFYYNGEWHNGDGSTVGQYVNRILMRAEKV